MDQPKIIRPTDTPPIPQRRVFMTGNGQPVHPKRAREVCDAIVNGCLDGRAGDDSYFVLGFAACFDAVSRGTIDLDADPLEMALQALHDVHNVTSMPNRVTNILREIEA